MSSASLRLLRSNVALAYAALPMTSATRPSACASGERSRDRHMEQAIKQSVQTNFTNGVPPNGLPSGTDNLRLGAIAESRNFLFPFSQRVSLTNIFAHCARSFASG